MEKQNICIVGAGINSLVAANYLQRAGCHVTMIERGDKVGGACISETANVNGVTQQYALGASVLGLMQDFVFEETGLAQKLDTFVPDHPKLIHFSSDDEPTWIYRDPAELDRELANKWGERGDVEAFRADEASRGCVSAGRVRQRSATDTRICPEFTGDNTHRVVGNRKCPCTVGSLLHQ